VVKQLQIYYDNYATEITKEESDKIEKELKEVEGFIDDVEAKEKEILDDRLGKIVREDKHLNEVAEAFVTLIKEKGYKIMEAVEIPEEGGGFRKLKVLNIRIF
jgi:cupin superfamily acireductone dioxygenase involved in methionine salvage